MIKFNHTGHKKYGTGFQKILTKLNMIGKVGSITADNMKYQKISVLLANTIAKTMTVMIIVTVARLFGRIM